VRVVVTGGAGHLGAAVLRGLAERGIPATSASRRSGVDLATGAGLEAALDGADVVLHAATSPLRHRRVDLGGTRRLVDIARRVAAPPHLVYVSIVGCDANPYPYYRTKAACEQVLADSGLPVSVVRATQFHSLVAGLARAARPLGVGLDLPGTAAQPCDVGWVAQRLVDIVAGPAPEGFRQVVDLAGPERLTLAEAVRLMATHDGHRPPPMLRLPAIGGVARSFALGSNLPGAQAQTGGTGFRRWLATQPPRH
jgi:uncharacterized protein YbjT (DUF2867 family)